jgi:hypothetical protein
MEHRLSQQQVIIRKIKGIKLLIEAKLSDRLSGITIVAKVKKKATASSRGNRRLARVGEKYTQPEYIITNIKLIVPLSTTHPW